MAVYEVFSQPEIRRYKTHLCSKATLVQLICVLLTFIPPFFIAYRSQGFWQRVDVYQEQGDIHFKHQLLVLVELQDENYVAWSTFQNFNLLQMDQLRVPLVKSREEDLNRDGKNDQLKFQLDMPLLDTDTVYGFKLLLFFDYKLYKYSSFQMESMAFLHHTSSQGGGTFETVGDLRFIQKEPLSHRGRDTRFNAPIIDSSSIYAEDYELTKIFQEYSLRNASTLFRDEYPLWITGRGAGRPFIIKTTIKYPEETLEYTPGFWHLIKWGWIQYVAVLLVFFFLFDRIKIFIFQNQLVTTVVDRPFKAKSF